MSADTIARLKITLDDVKPAVLRRIEVQLPPCGVGGIVEEAWGNVGDAKAQALRADGHAYSRPL